MEKPAITSVPIHPIIHKRWSPRSFSDKKVDPVTLQRIFEATRWAPSGFNEQPWRFMIGMKGDATWQRIFDALVDFNQKWAGLAPVLVAVVAKKTVTKNGKPNTSYKYDAGQAAAYLTFQSVSEGLSVHQMGGFNKEEIAQVFDLPEDFEPQTVIAMGYQDVPERLPEKFAEMELNARERKPLAELVFAGRFGEAASLSEQAAE